MARVWVLERAQALVSRARESGPVVLLSPVLEAALAGAQAQVLLQARVSDPVQLSGRASPPDSNLRLLRERCCRPRHNLRC